MTAILIDNEPDCNETLTLLLRAHCPMVQIVATCTSATALKKAELHYTSDTGLRSKRTWKSIPATIHANTITAPIPPADANTWYISVTDERDAMVSTEVILR